MNLEITAYCIFINVGLFSVILVKNSDLTCTVDNRGVVVTFYRLFSYHNRVMYFSN